MVEQPVIPSAVIEDLDNSLLLFFTGIKRSSSEVLTLQNNSTKSGDKKVLDSLHFIKQIGDDITKSLKKGDINSFGKLINTHWEYKQQLYYP